MPFPIFGFITGEFIDIIEWLDNTKDTMVFRFDRHDNEIKNGAKLIVRESQQAVFINEGTYADTFQPGTHTLSTQNLPILSTLKGWKYGFDSPFKAEVYFVNMKNFTNLKWGTKNPIMLRDPEFGPIRIRAFGNYSMRISDPTRFLKEIVGTNQQFNTEDIHEQLRDLLITRFTDLIGESKIPVLDMASNYNEFSKFIQEQLFVDFAAYGVDVTKVMVENISLPPNVEEMLDKRTSMGIVGNLDAFSKFQAANAIEQSAKNGGGMSDALNAGIGLSMANQFAQNQNQQHQQNQQNQQGNTTPPPMPPSLSYFVAVNGAQTGPFDTKTLSQMVMQGQFKKDSLVWRQGMAAWTSAGQLEELSPVFGAAPPPLPPPPPAM
ncbi:MAG: SPFH domain-containing protein [Bacteroidetes bacterium]|nr:MAG: SPFH domain-containing protein [Bacteroidota bacterium]